jgi:hypothetical protein
MKETINRISTRYEWLKAMPLVLLFLAVVGYGLLIPWLGFFWDDFPVAWIADKLGSAGLDRYFSYDRPLLSWLYRASVPLLGAQIPWHWHLFAVITRFTATLSFYGLVRVVWPKFPHLAVWAGLFFLVYPGFKQQWVSIIYGHFFLILTGLMVSFYLNIKVVKKKSQYNLLFSIAAWLLSLQNLLFMDYFFFLELIRPVLIWEALREQVLDRRKRAWQMLRSWLPYLILWIGVVIGRAAVMQSQPHRYEITLLNRLQAAPLTTLIELVKNILTSLWISIPVAWGMVFQPPGANLGIRSTTAAIVLASFTMTLLSIYLGFLRRNLQIEDESSKGALSIVWVGLLTCLAAGWSIWLTGLGVGTRFAADRFSLIFLPGAALISSGVIGLLPVRYPFPWLMVALLTSLAVGQQFITANQFRKDWELQQRFFWQLSWRAPTIKAGTLLLAGEFPFTFYTDNSLTAPINWFYSSKNTSSQMDFLLYYPSRRLGTSLPGLVPGLPVYRDYRAAIFEGNTSQVVGLIYEPPACLRVLDPDLDVENKMLPNIMQLSAALSMPSLMESTPEQSVSLPAQLYGQEPERTWCYYFEKADLARQQGNWEQVVALGDQAYATGDYPNDPMERIPFIEGYAHVGSWERAVELTHESLNVTPMMEPVLCRLWERISTATPTSPEKDETLQKLYDEMNCLQK